MKLPNFLIVGAAKCGTTSLYRYLSQHPDIFMPRWKELSLFIADPNRPLHSVNQPRYYERAFSKVTSETAVGEASTCYLYDASSPNLIKAALGAIKIIIVLRNPVDMAYSLYNHQLRKDGENLRPFEHALAAEDQRFHSCRFPKECYGWHANYYYFRRGLYHDQVKRYIDAFGEKNVKIFRFEALTKDPAAVSRQAYRFLGVDDDFVPSTKIFNKGGAKFNIPKFWEDMGLLQKTASFAFSKNLPRKLGLLIQKRHIGTAPPIDVATARGLAQRFLADIEQLEDLTGMDLGNWKSFYRSGIND